MEKTVNCLISKVNYLLKRQDKILQKIINLEESLIEINNEFKSIEALIDSIRDDSKFLKIMKENILLEFAET